MTTLAILTLVVFLVALGHALIKGGEQRRPHTTYTRYPTVPVVCIPATTIRPKPMPYTPMPMESEEDMYIRVLDHTRSPMHKRPVQHYGSNSRSRTLVDMSSTPSMWTPTLMANAILKSEQEEEMWDARTDAITVDELWYSSYFTAEGGFSHSPSPIEFLCECGSNATSCSEDRAINEQAEYDEANGLCLNCHQSPCCFDCCYDDDDNDWGSEADEEEAFWEEVAKRDAEPDMDQLWANVAKAFEALGK